mmetsp:Transcript_3771/g.9459  ORF Transcript_3771/g.9459 Transcript_3771/m.9459 type:complete len:136 (-) Transcript_3771:178-585(-)|eukprot:CAMPEP_0118828020 /NCGR_PEP_ID=MMETSP1162-20130426/16532_1 /TAXON_ID=33656 /ORGANISM="Phaeocystis Sp, Strain CCMP2710" /LENGTH=135 /DNA_ID=CAMNT_0006758935 /DNA_START=38 /DNA_END=445 /DNA_ORIENTATION=-
MADVDEGGFPVETRAKPKILQVLQNILGPTPFLQAKMGMWTTTIIENVLKELKEINDESAKAGQQDDEEMGQLWKFIVTCHIQQKTGAGMSSATCCYWDNENDGHFSVSFDNTGFDEKVGTDAIEAAVTVYFVAL